MMALRAALEKECEGGRMPVDECGEALVPASAFAAVAEAALAGTAATLPAEERERYPPWLTAYVQPMLEGDQQPVAPPHQLLTISVGSEGSGACLSADTEGVRQAEAAARPNVCSRVVAVVGSAGAGKSFLCRTLVEASVRAAVKAQGGGQWSLDALVPDVRPTPRGGGGGLAVGAEQGACTKGVVSYLARLERGSDDPEKGGTGRGGGGYTLPVRVLDTEGESQVSMAEKPAAGIAVDALLDAQVARSDAVLVGLPRLAFLTSDVVVLVTTQSLLSARVYARILSWAQVASGGVMLAARAPALLLVCNQLGKVVHPNGAVLREEAQLDVAAATKAFLRQHERGDSSFRPSSLLAASSRQCNPQQPRLGAFFRSVSVIHIPLAPAPPAAPQPHPLVAELASRQLGRFQAEVFRLAAAAQGGGVRWGRAAAGRP